ncbi:MAG: ATP phosphoribosyltransferase regulatory subunit, partial [Sphingobium sp.]
ESPKRLFLPLGADAARAAALRAEGWHTVAALSEGEDGAGQRCSHWLDGGDVRAY